jgi:pSer/pThr/pTyr-binding forkhead associated (FHA) protein
MYVSLTFEYRRRRRKWKRVLELKGDEFVLGRAHGNKVRIPSAQVSRRHTRLLVYKGYLLVEDLHSVNGTYLNGKPVHGFKPVRPGAKLEVGPVTFLVDYELTPGAHDRMEAFDGDVRGVKPVPPFRPPRKARPGARGRAAPAVEEVEEVVEVDEAESPDELEVVEEYTDDEDLPDAELIEEEPPSSRSAAKRPPRPAAKKKPRRP